MIIGGSLLIHGEKYAETVEDLPTLRRLIEGLEGALAEQAEISASIADPELRASFDATFADDVQRCNTVIETCRRRLAQ